MSAIQDLTADQEHSRFPGEEPGLTLPGSFDTLHTLQLFRSDNSLGIPILPHAPLIYTPERLIGYRTRVRDRQGTRGAALHFFLDDYRFETVWGRPEKARSVLEAYRTLLTPDFSLYADWPLAVQQWNVYRSRWCGALWTSWGMQVIPTVSWGSPASFSFCFVGIPKRSLVAVSTVGVRITDQPMFEQGYREMIRRLEPSRVLCYGRIDYLKALVDGVDTIGFAPDKRFVRL